VRSADIVTGPYDVVARVEAASIDALGRLVVSKIQGVEVKGTESSDRVQAASSYS
jgi:hypothetical protein